MKVSDFGRNEFTPVRNYDLDKDIQEFRKTNNPDSSEQLGYTTKTGYEGITPRLKEVISAKVDSILADPDSLAVAHHLATGELTRKVTDPEAIKATRDYLTKRFEGAYESKTTISRDMSLANYELSKNKEAREAKKDEKDQAKIGEPVDPTPETYGHKGVAMIPSGVKSVPIVGKVVLPAIPINESSVDDRGGKSQKTITNAQVLNYTFDDKGRLMANVSYATAKTKYDANGNPTQQVNEKKNIFLSKENKAQLAKALGVSIDQLEKSAGYTPSAETFDAEAFYKKYKSNK
jgi:hypothetical protein